MRALFIVVFFFPVFAFAEMINYRSDIEFLSFDEQKNRLTPAKVRIRYEEDSQTAYFFIDEGSHVIGFSLNQENMQNLQDALSKYVTWEEKAIVNRLRYERQLGELPINSGFWQEKKRNWELDQNPQAGIRLIFSSDDEETHQLVWLFPEFVGGVNGHKPKKLHLAKKGVTQLLSAMDQKAIDTFLAEKKKRESLASGN